MSLWDTDKTGDNRESPTLNQHDNALQRMANSTTSLNPVTDATNAALVGGIYSGAFRIVMSGTTTLLAPSVTLSANQTGQTAQVADVTHNLGYVPAVVAFLATSTNISIPVTTFTLQSAALNNWTISSMYYHATTTTVSFYSDALVSTTAGGTFNGLWSGTVKYYLLQQQISN